MSDLDAPLVEAKKWRPQFVWVVPLVAALVGTSLLVNSLHDRGPRITVIFSSGEGLQVGKTPVKYRSVAIGRVTGLALSRAQDSVEVTIDLDRTAANAATVGSQFWVQHPVLGIGSGVDSLLAGAFIGVEMGHSGTSKRSFRGLDGAPALSHGPNGRLLTLHAETLGSLTPGAPVYLRRVQVGRVLQAGLDEKGDGAKIAVFIDAPNDRRVSARTRFWNASGIDLSVNADGLNLRTESMAAILTGGIAFEDAPPEFSSLATSLLLYKDRESAFAPMTGASHTVHMRFKQTLRGLTVNAPVELLGVNIGHVSALDLEFDPLAASFYVQVTALIYPELMGRAYESETSAGGTFSEDQTAKLVAKLVERGLRIQPRIGSLLTGQLYLEASFLPRSQHVAFDAARRPIELPTVESSAGEIQIRLASVASKLDDLPWKSIGTRLDGDLGAVHDVLGHLDHDLLPPAAQTLTEARAALLSVQRALSSDSPLSRRIDKTLQDADSSLLEISSLADYLYRHPESLIRGRGEKP